jgi:hypothetical protein
LAKGNYWTEAEFIERFIAQYQLASNLFPLLNALFRSFLVGRELKFMSHKVHALKISAIAKVVGNKVSYYTLAKTRENAKYTIFSCRSSMSNTLAYYAIL